MARLPRICLPSIAQHIIQYGNDRQVCFASEEDFTAYAYWLDGYSKKYKVAIHAWVFMTNHVHFLVTPETEDGVSKMMQAVGRHHVRYFNHIYKRTGTLWEGRLKSCVVDTENYFLICQRYIELNPVRAGMVIAPGDYAWSSFRSNGLGENIKLWTPHPVYCALGATPAERSTAYRDLFVGYLELNVLTQICEALNQGMVLGNDRFKQEIEYLAGRRVTTLMRGPKSKAKLTAK